METETGEVRVVETMGGRDQRRSQKKTKRKRKEKVRREENSRSKKDSGRVGNLGRGRGSEEIGSQEVPSVD